MTQMRWGGIKSGESGLASSHVLMCTPQLDHSEMFTELYREEKKEAGDRGGQKDATSEKIWGGPAHPPRSLHIKSIWGAGDSSAQPQDGHE